MGHQRNPAAVLMRVQRRRGAWVAVGVLLVLPCVLTAHRVLPHAEAIEVTIGFTCAFVGFGCLLLATLASPPPVGGPGRAVQSLLAGAGRRSYSIYLWHWLVLRGVQQGLARALGHQPGYLLTLMVGLGAALVVGIVMEDIVELRVLALRERWFPPRMAGAASAPAVVESAAQLS